jgi:hypothetical protein
MFSKFKWKNVPEEYEDVWVKIFSTTNEGVNLSSPCPICGQTTLHHYYQQIGPKKDFILHDRKYIGKGDLWEWCSSCHTFERYYAAVPDWWDFSLPIDNSQVMSYPDALEEAIREV